MKLARLPDGSPEVFRTLQGEGVSLGCPAVFLRLSLCNLHCTWCDTPFTWNWEGTPWPHQDDRKYRKGDHLVDESVDDIMTLLVAAAREGDRLVITGGEPLLQQDELVTLLSKIPDLFSGVEIETNSTQKPTPQLDAFVTQYNVSPKLSNSGNDAKLRLDEQALEFFAAKERAFFKFVVLDQKDLTEILDLQNTYQLPGERILLMPEGRTPAALAENRHWIARTCLEHGFRLTDRLHVQLWGDQRGR